MNSPITPAQLSATLAATDSQVFQFGAGREAGAYKTMFYETSLLIRDPAGKVTKRQPVFKLEINSEDQDDWIPLARGAPKKGDLTDKRNTPGEKYAPMISFHISTLNDFLPGKVDASREETKNPQTNPGSFGNSWVGLSNAWLKDMETACATGTVKKGLRRILPLYYCQNREGEPVENPQLSLKVVPEKKYSPKHPNLDLRDKPMLNISDARKPIKTMVSAKTRSGRTKLVEKIIGYEPYIHHDAEGNPVPITEENVHEVLRDGTKVKFAQWLGSGASGASATLSMPMTLFAIVIAPYEGNFVSYGNDEDDLLSDDEEEAPATNSTTTGQASSSSTDELSE